MPSENTVRGRLRQAKVKAAPVKYLVGPSEIPVADWYLGGGTYNQNAIAMEINRLISTGQLRKFIRKFIKAEFKRCPELKSFPQT